MQLSAVVAQPATTPPPSAPSPFLRMTSILRGTPLPAEAGAPTEAPAAPPADDAVPVPSASIAVEDAGFAARIATKQNQYLANQQLLGAISAGLGARLSQLGAQAWALLRGTAPVDGQ